MNPCVMKLTPEQVNQIEGLTNAGYTDTEIARRFGGITASSIQYWRKKLGIKTKFTYEKVSKCDHSKLVELFNAGWSDYRIARALGLKPCSVFSYRKYHGIQRTENLKYNKALKPTTFQLEVLIGTLMGDGSMRRTNTNASFICMHGIKQREYCELKRELLAGLGAKASYHKRKTIDERTGIYYEDYTVKLPCNPELNGLYDAFYPNGKKVLPESVLDDYTAVSLAFHFMDDGYKSKNGYFIATQSFDRSSLEKFTAFLKERFDLDTTIIKTNQVYIRKQSVARFTELVLPYFCDSMLYKLHRVS